MREYITFITRFLPLSLFCIVPEHAVAKRNRAACLFLSPPSRGGQTIQKLAEFLVTEEGNGCFMLEHPLWQDIAWILNRGLAWEEIAVWNFCPETKEAALATYGKLLKKKQPVFFEEIAVNYCKNRISHTYFVTFWLKK